MIEGAPPPRALYLHYPFCAHRCHYCDFSVKRAAIPPVEEWLENIATELAWWFDTAGWIPPVQLDSLFVGGGTPSLLGSEHPVRLAGTLGRWFVIDDDVEWTIESNPASLTGPVAAGWRAAGANRLSVGIQALDDDALTWLGRLHDRGTALRALEVARDAGFVNVSVDLMFGLPETVVRDLDLEVESLLAAGIEHVSTYGLTVEPRTPLARWVDLGRVTPLTPEKYAAEYRRVSRAFSNAGMHQYEVSSFAHDGRECRHNWYYWNRMSYLGLGPSAHGFFPPYRIWNEFRWDRYRSAVGSGAGPMAGYEELTAEDEALERLWLGLRTRLGLSRDEPAWSAALEKHLAVWETEGWIDVSRNRVVATVEGWLRLDELVAEIARDLMPMANQDMD